MAGGRGQIAASVTWWATCSVFSVAPACGRSPVFDGGLAAEAGASDDPNGPSHGCEWSSACDHTPCADTERSAAALEALIAHAEARGYSDVLEPLHAEQVGMNVVLTVALRHPSFEAISTFVTTSASFADIPAHVDEWGDTWLDPTVTVATQAQIQEEIDRCASARAASSCGPTATTAYDPCTHNQPDFTILVGLAETDDVEFVRGIDARTGSGLFCSYGQC